jgi:hypothetical protein
MKLAKKVSPLAVKSSQLDSHINIRKRVNSYSRLNYVMIGIGLILLLIFVLFNLSESVTVVLASVGIYFLLQLSPLATPGIRTLISDLKAAQTQTREHQKNPRYSSKLFEYVSPLQIGIALALFLIWLVMKLLQWNGDMNTQLLNIGIFAISQLFLAVLIARNLFVIQRDGNEVGNKGIEDPKIAVPILIYLSIGVSIYSLAKQLMLNLDLHHIRPIMMSASLQLLALLAFDGQLRELNRSASSSANITQQND